MERFKLRILSLVSCLAVTGTMPLHAAVVQYLWDKTSNVPALKQVTVVNQASSRKEIIPPQAQLFDLGHPLKRGQYEYRLRNAFIDPQKVTHARYDEYYRHLRVLWADTVVHRKKSQSINGTFVTDIEKDVPTIQPKLSADAAVAIAKHDFSKNVARKNIVNVKAAQTELVIYPYGKDANGSDVAHLAYYVSYYANLDNHKLSNPTYVIDANTGIVLTYFDNLKRLEQEVGKGPGGNTNPVLTNGVYNYGVGAAPLLGALLIQTDTPAVGTCTWGNRGVAVVDMGNATNNPSVFPIMQDNEFNYPVRTITPCNLGTNYINPGDATPNGGYSPIDDILYYGTQTYNLFVNNSLRNPRFPFGTNVPAIRYYVNLDSTDAFAQNSGCGNVPDSCYNQQAVFGNGETQMYPQVGYDVVGHETAHIYVGLTSQLVYANQSGALNEAFADITGATLGAYIGQTYTWFPPISSQAPLNNPLGISFWTQGALDSKVSPALRYLYNPPLNGSAIDNAANYTPGMGVHDGSGVYNKAFYNMSVSFGSGAIVNYPAILRAYRFIVAANDTYWTSNTDYNHGACGVMMAANNPALGGGPAFLNATRNAFAAVGVHCTRGLNNISVTE